MITSSDNPRTQSAIARQVLAGDDRDNLLYEQPGPEAVNGGLGIDTLVLRGISRDYYTLRVEPGRIVLSHRHEGLDGVDTVANVEKLRFIGGDPDMSPGGVIGRMYEALFDTAPDDEGLAYWNGMHASGALSLRDIATALVDSSDTQGGLSNVEFVDLLFLNGLDRPGNLKELSQYTWRFGELGHTRADVLLAFAAEPGPMLAHEKSRGLEMDFSATDVGSLVRMYDVLFDRAPDQDGLNHWIGVSEDGTALARIADAFVAGSEFSAGAMSNADFVAHLYQAGLERTGSPGEIAGWVGHIDSGALSRGEVLLAIADSNEMVELVGMLSTSLALD